MGWSREVDSTYDELRKSNKNRDREEVEELILRMDIKTRRRILEKVNENLAYENLCFQIVPVVNLMISFFLSFYSSLAAIVVGISLIFLDLLIFRSSSVGRLSYLKAVLKLNLNEPEIYVEEVDIEEDKMSEEKKKISIIRVEYKKSGSDTELRIDIPDIGTKTELKIASDVDLKTEPVEKP